MNPQHSNMATSEEIYEDLCLKIEKLEYMPGDRLSENELCRIYDVTRHVVRNALASLKQRRLVDVYPQRGTYVSLIDMDYIGDILYMREAVEQEALARIMERSVTKTELAEPKDVEQQGKTEQGSDCDEKAAVQAAIQRMKRAAEAQQNLEKGPSYHEEFYTLDNIFHLALLEAVDKPNVMNLISEPYIHIRRWRNYEIRSEKRMQEIIVEHQKILDAIEAGDAKEARECLHQHLDTVNRYSKPLKEMEAQYFTSEVNL